MSTHSRRAECGAVPKIVFARLVVALAVANVVAEHLGSATGVKARLCMEFGINWWKRGPADTGIIDSHAVGLAVDIKRDGIILFAGA